MSDRSDKDTKDPAKGDKDKSDDKPRGSAARTGHVRPADPALVEWLERLWTRKNPPDRLDLWWVLGPNHDHRKNLVFYENFSQDDALNIEECTRLAGEMLTAAKDWTDNKRKLCWYEVAITDFHQGAVPLTRGIGPLLPQQAYAGARPDGDSDGEDEGDGEIGLKPLSHKYLSKTIRSMHKMMTETHAVIGDTMRLQQAIIVSQQSHNERMQNANMALYDQKQVAEDRATERAMWVQREQMKNKAIGAGLRAGETMLYGWLGMTANDNEDAAPANDNHSAPASANDNNGSKAPVRRRAVVSPEQRLVGTFLEEAAEEKLSIQLFGDWQDKEGLTLSDVFAGRGLERPGIFTPQQFGILLGVRAGVLPADDLDALLPDSGQPAAISPQQIVQAQPLMTPGMGMAFEQIRQIRMAARDKRQAAAAPQQGKVLQSAG